MVATIGSVCSMQDGSHVDRVPAISKEIREIFTTILQQGPPQYRKSEDWKYTDIRAMLSANFPQIFPIIEEDILNLTPQEQREIDSVRLVSARNFVFVNGVFCSQYSDTPLSQDFFQRGDGTFFQQFPKGGLNYFAALSFLYASDGICFSKTTDQHEQPMRVHCIFLHRDSVESPQLLYHQIHVAPQQHAEIWMTYLGKGRSISFTGIYLEKDATLSYRQLFKEQLDSTHMNHTIVAQQEASNFQSFQMALGGGLTRSSMSVFQMEGQATARVDSLYAIRQQECVDFAVDIFHEVGETVSRQLCKGILLDASRFIYRSKVQVARDATNADAHQENKNLLLGEDARVDARPQLDILHDAVQCAHGSAIGQLDDEQLFYLKSRAIGSSLSKKILSRGFVEEVCQIHPFTLDQQLFLKSIFDAYFFQHL